MYATGLSSNPVLIFVCLLGFLIVMLVWKIKRVLAMKRELGELRKRNAMMSRILASIAMSTDGTARCALIFDPGKRLSIQMVREGERGTAVWDVVDVEED